MIVVELSQAAVGAIALITSTLNERGVAYQITGGLAGNLHGSQWPLGDLDIEVDGDLANVAALFRSYVTWGPGRYVDDEFDLDLLQLNVGGIDVDIKSVNEFYVLTRQGRLKIETDLGLSLDAEISGLAVKVQPLEDLIRYKRLLNRTIDVTDLESLRTTSPLRRADPRLPPG